MRQAWCHASIFATILGIAAGGALPATAQDRTQALRFNTFGGAGLLDMPVAFSRPDGELAYTVSHTPNQTRHQLSFQLFDRLGVTARYSLLKDIRVRLGSGVVPERFDQSFSLHYRLLDEGRYRPAVAIGMRDFAGNAIYGSEYVVASKSLTPRLRATLGMGWGRLGRDGGFSNPLGALDDRFRTRSGRTGGAFGGQPNHDQWFRGDAALFGGVAWQASDRLAFFAEYSSDDYAREDQIVNRRSPINLGASYQATENTQVSAQVMHGSQLGVQLTYALDPRRGRAGSGLDAAPQPVLPRNAVTAPTTHANELHAALLAEGIVLNRVLRDGDRLRVEISNERYSIASQAVGRTARVLTRHAPAEVAWFDIILAEHSMPISEISLARDDLEAHEFSADAPQALRAGTHITDSPQGVGQGGSVPEARYPRARVSLEPFVAPSFFDPDSPLRADVGAALVARGELAPGFVLSGRVHQKAFGNLDTTRRSSDSPLPRVRSDAPRYHRESGSTTLQELTAAYYSRLGPDLFGRVTAGYLEPMFGGVSGEVLWQPADSRLGLGVEVNYARQRDFDQLFGFRDFSVVSGHVSGYYALGGGYHAQIDVGRYLAGDVGATFNFAREFSNGLRVGAFATFTDVSASDFGEGRFDKGIRITIPIDSLSGRPTRERTDITFRGTQRDGGARLNLQGRLHDEVRGAQLRRLEANWGRVWR